MSEAGEVTYKYKQKFHKDKDYLKNCSPFIGSNNKTRICPNRGRMGGGGVKGRIKASVSLQYRK
jgi:hypothetical protein